MSSVTTPVSTLLDPSCGVPPDIVFKIIGITNSSHGEVATKTILGEVRAHKTILALRAPVFLRQFHGQFPSPAEVNVEDTSLIAFKILIGHIYQAKDDWANLGLHDVFKVAGLADKYLLPCLMEKAVAYLLDFKISDENLLESATVAEDFCLLSKASSTLLDHCASFIKKKLLKSSFYAVDMAKKYSTDPTLAITTMKLLARVTKPKACSNCGVDECRNGKIVKSKSELALGTRLKTIGPNWNGPGPAGSVGEKCTVTKLDVENRTWALKSWERVTVQFDGGQSNKVYVSGIAGKERKDGKENGDANLVFNCRKM